MEMLVLYESSNGEAFCLLQDWNKVKSNLHGNVNYAMFPLLNRKPSEISKKISEIREGTACPRKGGHLCLK